MCRTYCSLAVEGFCLILENYIQYFNVNLYRHDFHTFTYMFCNSNECELNSREILVNVWEGMLTYILRAYTPSRNMFQESIENSEEKGEEQKRQSGSVYATIRSPPNSKVNVVFKRSANFSNISAANAAAAAAHRRYFYWVPCFSADLTQNAQPFNSHTAYLCNAFWWCKAVCKASSHYSRDSYHHTRLELVCRRYRSSTMHFSKSLRYNTVVEYKFAQSCQKFTKCACSFDTIKTNVCIYHTWQK